MSNYSRKILIAMATTYDFFAANPDSTARDLADEFDLKIDTARNWCAKLSAMGGLTRKKGKREQQQPDRFTVVPSARPQQEQPRYAKPRPGDVARECKHIMVKAKQIGMPRDPLVSALFGAPAVAA